MRAAFGLVSLLVTLAVMLFIFKYLQAPVIKEGKKAQDQARQITGRDEEGARVTDALTLDAQDRNGKMESVIVTDVKADSAIQKRYGLQTGDVIVQMGELTVRDHMSSPDEAKDFLLKAYQESRDLVVIRGWDKLTLPMPEGVAPPPAAAAASAATKSPAPAAQPGSAQASGADKETQPATPPAKQRDNRGALERQLDLIKNIPGQ